MLKKSKAKIKNMFVSPPPTRVKNKPPGQKIIFHKKIEIIFFLKIICFHFWKMLESRRIDNLNKYTQIEHKQLISGLDRYLVTPFMMKY